MKLPVSAGTVDTLNSQNWTKQVGEREHEVTWENGKKTHRSKSCYGSHGNRGGVNGRRFVFRPSVHSGQSWTVAPRWTKSEKDDRKMEIVLFSSYW